MVAGFFQLYINTPVWLEKNLRSSAFICG